jgi:hypothetical protein
MNRNIAFGVLVFSFALVMLAFKPTGGTFTINIPELPEEWYKYLGILSIIISLLFLLAPVKQQWSQTAENIFQNKWFYSLWIIIFEGLFIISFIKGYIGVHEVLVSDWLDRLIFYFGVAIAIYVPIISWIYFPKDKKK